MRRQPRALQRPGRVGPSGSARASRQESIPTAVRSSAAQRRRHRTVGRLPDMRSAVQPLCSGRRQDLKQRTTSMQAACCSPGRWPPGGTLVNQAAINQGGAPRLDRLHHAKHGAGLHLAADLRHLHVHDVAQLGLRRTGAQ